MTQTIILKGERQRELAKSLIDKAGPDFVIRIGPPSRSLEANAKMWAMLSDVSRAKPEGRVHIPEVWKCIFMAACGHEVTFEHGIDGRPFPLGFSSSRLTKAQMSDLIEMIFSYGAKHGVKWSDYYE